MKQKNNKYLRISSSFVLSLYLLIIFIGSFHPHHIDYFSHASFVQLNKNASAFEEPFCLFNQMNKPVYFYYFTANISVENQNEVISCFLPIDPNQHSESYFYFINLRAPPQFV